MILISACLAGFNVRYDGGNAQNDLAVKLVALGKAITVCPEIMGGLKTPRTPAEIQGGTGDDVLAGRALVVSRDGVDVTKRYLASAHRVLQIAQDNDVQVAFLKQKSPACGTKLVYDGSFSGRRIPGFGVTAALLHQKGITVFGDEDLTIATLRPYLDQGTVDLLENDNLRS
ncbi:DUF523 domain-containing protein [Limosilactobacillus avium]|uniref:DUF523 domain-containing protein n=1 Tax=Limosilactobacillus avium TaxID=2991831 RepID=UPI0024BA40C6|nr:DUF523 domain-containing protein [Limosilactobacillus avium]